MKILIVDDEMMMLEETKENVLAASPDSEITCVDNYVDALKAVEETAFDIACLDIEMPGMNGLELAKRMKDQCADINIIFVTAYSEYALQAHELYCSGYLLKPIRKSAVEKAFANLRHPVVEEKKNEKLYIQCFGKFEVFLGNKALKFQRERAKEIFAYLVNQKGTPATTQEICNALWEDEANTEKKAYFRVLMGDLRNALKKANAADLLIAEKNHYSIDVEKADCDFYQFLKGDARAVNGYHGEYMIQYSWAEMTVGYLKKQKETKET